MGYICEIMPISAHSIIQEHFFCCVHKNVEGRNKGKFRNISWQSSHTKKKNNIQQNAPIKTELFSISAIFIPPPNQNRMCL